MYSMGMRYQLVWDNSPQGLATLVMGLLNQGWQLQGGVSVCALDDARYSRGTLLYAQAMVNSAP